MLFEDSKYYIKLKPHKIMMPYGNFYLCDTFYIAEIYEGVDIDHRNLKGLMTILINYYGEDKKIGRLANRINSYSIDPHLYNRIDQEFDLIIASAFVLYSEISYMNAAIEKRLSRKIIKRFLSLDEAVEWIRDLKELKA